MSVIIDTSVWIPALQQGNAAEKQEVDRLLAEDDAAMVGVVLVEILRGARSESDFLRYRARLDAIPMVESTAETWVLAGRLMFDLARQGQSIPLNDAIIAAHALVASYELFTRDEHFRRVPGLQLYEPRRT
jgi:predicted nucleic acid-binding protein